MRTFYPGEIYPLPTCLKRGFSICKYCSTLSFRCPSTMLIPCRFDALVLRLALGKVEGFFWCSAPGCEQGQIHKPSEGDPESVFKCNECGHLSCVPCKSAWHEGQSCEEFKTSSRLQHKMSDDERKRAEDERLSEAVIRKWTHKCPGQGCNTPIIRDDTAIDGNEYHGCDKVQCKYK